MSEPVKGPADHLQLGTWNARCFICGCKMKAAMAKKYWQGFYTCPDCWEPRQPQDFARGVPDRQTPAWTQPTPEPVFAITFDPLPDPNLD